MRARFCWLLLWGMAVAGVCYASLTPDMAPPGMVGIDKLEHAGAYFLLSLLAILAFAPHRRRLAALGFLFLLGAALEVLQGIVGGREASVVDQIANSAGILLALAGLAWLQRRRRA